MTPDPASTPVSSDFTAPPPKRVARWEDFIDVFYAPSSVFRRRQNESFWVPWLIVSVAIGLVMFATLDAMTPLLQATMRRAMTEAATKNPELTSATAESMQSIGLAFAKVMMMVSTPVAILGVGLVAWLVGKMFGARQSANAALVVAAYAYVLRAVGAVISGIELLVLDVADMQSLYALSIGPARFLNPATTSDAVYQVALRFDVITIWVTVLIGIGYMSTGGLSRGKAIAAALTLWFLATAPALVKLALA